MLQETVPSKKNPGEWLIIQGKHPHWTGNKAQGCLIVLMSAFLVTGAILHKHEVFGPKLPEEVMDRFVVFKNVYYAISFFWYLLYLYEVFIYNPYYRKYLDPANKPTNSTPVEESELEESELEEGHPEVTRDVSRSREQCVVQRLTEPRPLAPLPDQTSLPGYQDWHLKATALEGTYIEKPVSNGGLTHHTTTKKMIDWTCGCGC